MKLRISSSILLLVLATPTFASYTPIKSPASGTFYVGAFGGSGSSNDLASSQFGTAFFTEAQGGPLAINAFGQLDNQNGSFFGVQLGYQAPEISLSSSKWTLGPAAELEGFTMNKRTFNGTLFNNTERLGERDFTVSYPMKRSVFLANAILNFNNVCSPIHPYIGIGFGSAIVKIQDANAVQVNPLEDGFNHYNASSSDTISTFAGQLKLGLSYDILKCVSLFAEYRRLYLTSTHFMFGSTVYPAHSPTSSWQLKLEDQKYNLGNVGIRFNW